MQILPLTPYPPAWPKVLPAPAKQSNPVLHLLPNPFPDPIPPNPYETATHYDTLAAALQPILDGHPQVIAFGKLHPYWQCDCSSTNLIFADQVLPLLAQEGIRDLILEQILNDPAIVLELDKYYQDQIDTLSQDSTPILWASLQIYSDKAEIVRILEKAKELGIRVHPGGMTLAEASETINQPEWDYNVQLNLRAWRYTENATRQQADRLLGQNRRFAIYGGAKHQNQVAHRILEIEGGTNYGQYFFNKLGNKYAEAALFPSEGLNNLPDSINDLFDLPTDGPLSSTEGVLALQRGSGRIIIY